MVLCLGEPPRSFWDVSCCSFHFCIFISFLIFILLLFFICRCSSFTFAFRHHPSPFRGLSPGFYTHYILSVQPIAEWYSHFQPFRYLLTASATDLCGHFLLTDIFYLTLLHRHFNLRLSRPAWEPAVLPWSLQGFILILVTKTQPICLINSNPQSSYSERFSFKFYHILLWIGCGEIYLLLTRFELLSLVQSHIKTIKKHFEQDLTCTAYNRFDEHQSSVRRYIKCSVSNRYEMLLVSFKYLFNSK